VTASDPFTRFVALPSKSVTVTSQSTRAASGPYRRRDHQRHATLADYRRACTTDECRSRRWIHHEACARNHNIPPVSFNECIPQRRFLDLILSDSVHAVLTYAKRSQHFTTVVRTATVESFARFPDSAMLAKLFFSRLAISVKAFRASVSVRSVEPRC